MLALVGYGLAAVTKPVFPLVASVGAALAFAAALLAPATWLRALPCWWEMQRAV